MGRQGLFRGRRRAFRRQRDQAFDNPRQYRRFLREAHLTHDQILFRVSDYRGAGES